MNIEIPKAFARATIDREGEAGRRWIDALPEVATDLCGRWDLEVAGEPRHGYAGLVLPVRRGQTRLALKIGWIDGSSRQEALVLRHWDGNGAVRLVDDDPDLGALLLEWLDPDRTLLSIPADDATKIAGRLLRRLAVSAPPDLETVASETATLARTFRDRWNAVGRPFREALVSRAVETCRSESTAFELVVNRDLHYENVLAGSREPWLVIDPKALAGPLEFGVAQLLWNRFDDLGNRRGFARRLDIITDAADIARDRATRWSLVRVLDYWLWALEEGLTEDPARCALLAGWLSDPIGVR